MIHRKNNQKLGVIRDLILVGDSVCGGGGGG